MFHLFFDRLPPIKLFMTQPSSQVTQNATLPVATTSPNFVPNAPLIAFLAIALALSLVLTSFGYKKYRVRQQSQLLKRQIAMLEAIWRISSTKRER